MSSTDSGRICDLIAKIFAGIAAAIALWTLSLPIYCDFCFLILLLGLGIKLPARDFGLVAVSVIIGIVLFGPVSKLLIETGTASAFYREHEQFARLGQTYQPS